MGKTIVAVAIALLIGSACTYSFLHLREGEYEHDLTAKLFTVEQELSQTKTNLLGYTKFTDYLAVTKTTMSEQMKFLAATIDREYTLVENIEKTKLGLRSEATIIVKYAVEYSVGYDLKPESFLVTGDQKSITVTLKRPDIVAAPAVKMISHEIPSKGFLTDEKEAVIALQQQLHIVAKKHGYEVKKEEAVIALCEKKLGEFLRDFLSKQPNVKIVPAIKFVYK